MRGILIDDRGEFWSEAAPILRMSFAPSRSSDGLAAYLVRNLGFCAIDAFGHSCQVRFRPDLTTAETVETVDRWLRSNKYERIALATLGSDRHLELCASTDTAVARIAELIQASGHRRCDNFIARPRDLTTVDQYPAFATLTENWNLLTRQINPAKLSRMVSQMTGGRFVVAAPEPGGERLILQGAGSGYKTLDRKWALEARGAPIEDQADQSYGRWVASGYERVLKEGAPIIEDVDAIVATPEYGRYRIRYTRYMLPYRDDEQTWLLSSSLLDDRIDLRLDRVSENTGVTRMVGAAKPTGQVGEQMAVVHP
ncbi:MAG: hypothetical protein AAFR70_04550 [Pseudomonadota bacterium]